MHLKKNRIGTVPVSSVAEQIVTANAIIRLQNVFRIGISGYQDSAN